MNPITQAMNVVFDNNSAYTADDQNTMNVDTFTDQCLGTSGWWTTDGITFTQLEDFAQQMAVGRVLSHCERLADSMFFEDKAKDEEKQRKFELQIDEEVEAISYWASRFGRRQDVVSFENIVSNIAANVAAKAQGKSDDHSAIKFKAEILKVSVEEIAKAEGERAEAELVDREKWYINNAKRILSKIVSAWEGGTDWNPSDQEVRYYFESAFTKLSDRLLGKDRLGAASQDERPPLEKKFASCRNDLDRDDESRLRALGLEVLATRAAIQSAKDQLAKYPTVASNKEVRERYDEQLNQLLSAMH